MDGMQKIGFVSIILLVGLFSLQMGLQKQDFYKPHASENIQRIESEPVEYMEDLKNYQGPLLFPIDTIRKYYLDPSKRELLL